MARIGGKIMEYITLNNGVKMPMAGFGVFQIKDKEECVRVVLEAIETGYRLIDTAQSYGNEEAVGEAILKTNVPREELFVTTKVWITNYGYEKAKASVEESLEKMNQKYGVQLEAWAPFAEGKKGIFTNETLMGIGEKYNKSVGQVILRWLVQRGIVPLAKTVRKERMLENIDIFDFQLSEEDMKTITNMNKDTSSFFSHYDPATVEMICGLKR